MQIRTIITNILIFCLSIFFFNTNAQSLEIIRNGKSSYKIIIPSKPTLIEKKAADILQYYLFKISGASLPIIEEDNHPYPYEIQIGRTKASKIINYSKLQPDGIAIKSYKNTLFLTGGNRKGVLYSVYTFLEDELGCRKYTKDLSYIPKEKSIIIKPVNKLENPAFGFRTTYFIDAFDTSYDDWNKLNYFFEGWGTFAHTFQTLLPPSDYFQTHPEYFALINGKRSPAQPCLSNPIVLKIMIANLQKEISSKPDAKYWSVSQNDNIEYCHCSLCEPKNLRENGYQGTLLPFVNNVARHFPNKIITTLAYNQSMMPPNTIRPASNVEIMLCSSNVNRGKSITMSEDSGTIRFKKALDKWQELTPNLFIWDYIVNYFNVIYPYPNIYTLQANIQYFKKKKVKMLFEEGIGRQQGDFSELRCYLISKLMWNPNINVEKCTNEFLKAYYGPASNEIKAYLYLRYKEFQNSRESLGPWDNPINHKNGFLSEENIDKYLRIIKKAEQLTKEYPTYYKRVVRDRLGIEFAELEIASYDHNRAIELEKRENIETFLQKFKEACNQSGISLLSENGRSPSQFIESIKGRLK